MQILSSESQSIFLFSFKRLATLKYLVRRSVAGTARGPAEAGEWGGPCPVVGARKALGLNSAGQLELRDRMVEIRTGATSYA